MSGPGFAHKSVLYDACLEALAVKSDGCYVDGTAGGGGHSSGILKALGPGGRLHAFDRDEDAIQAAGARLRATESAGKWFLHHNNYAQMPEVLRQAGESKADGILLDLGVSSWQLDQRERGFSYRFDGPLDMRMDRSCGISAAELLAEADEAEIRRILRDYGEEREAYRIARAIVRRREEKGPLQSTAELADLIVSCMPAKSRREKGHPAKRSFQALRIAVNHELDELETFLGFAPEWLSPDGRLAVITFHSLEDRLVKQAFRKWEKPCTCPPHLPCVCGKKSLGREEPRGGIVPDREEEEENPRAHSARLRVFVRNANEVK